MKKIKLGDGVRASHKFTIKLPILSDDGASRVLSNVTPPSSPVCVKSLFLKATEPSPLQSERVT
jgi:hypothetical protein